MMKELAIYKFSVYHCSDIYMYIHNLSLTVFNNNHRAGYVSEKAYIRITPMLGSSEPLYL